MITDYQDQLLRMIEKGLKAKLTNLEVGKTMALRFSDGQCAIKAYPTTAINKHPCTGCLFRSPRYEVLSNDFNKNCAFIHTCTGPKRPDNTSVIYIKQ